MHPTINCYTESTGTAYAQFLRLHKLELDVYYTSEFLKVEAEMQGGTYEVFVVCFNQSVFIYPYIRLSFESNGVSVTDISSPYGYCGPFCNDNSFFEIAETLFLNYAKEQCFVTEFIRYHYLYNVEQKFKQNVNNFHNRFIVMLDLQNTWDHIWLKEMSGTNRNIVRKLEKEDYTVEVSHGTNHLDEFIDMYRKTMDHAGAEKFYYFEKNYYYNLFNSLKELIFLVRVRKEGVTHASSLFFISGSILTYYLSARNLQYTSIPASNLMLTEAARYGHQLNLSIFNLGGGRINSIEDPLFRFKRSFSRSSADFFIGKRVHNPDVYRQLTEWYIEKNGMEKYEQVKAFLQFYRNG